MYRRYVTMLMYYFSRNIQFSVERVNDYNKDPQSRQFWQKVSHCDKCRSPSRNSRIIITTEGRCSTAHFILILIKRFTSLTQWRHIPDNDKVLYQNWTLFNHKRFVMIKNASSLCWSYGTLDGTWDKIWWLRQSRISIKKFMLCNGILTMSVTYLILISLYGLLLNCSPRSPI